MGDKMECPACEARSSTVRASYASGDGCPFCGLSSSAMAEIFGIRHWRASEALTSAYIQAVRARDRAETRLRKVENKIQRIFEVLDET